MAKPDIYIIGAGPVGLSCGINALNNGFAVSIISEDFNHSPRMAGLVAGGMLAPAYECLCQSDDVFNDFAFKSRFLWDDLAAQCGIDIVPNALSLANSVAEHDFLEQQIIAAQQQGFDFELIPPPDGVNIKYALHLKSDGLINPVIGHEKLVKRFINLGGNLIFDKIQNIDNQNIIGANGVYNFDKLIIAAGYSAIEFWDIIPELGNLHPTRGQVIEIDARPIFNGSMRHKTTYIMARNGNVVVGATSDNSASWVANDIDAQELHKNACELIPSLKGKNIIAQRAGIRPNTIDELPILGQSSINNIYLATGAYRNGWLLAPAIADYVIKSLDNDPMTYSYTRFK